MEKQGGRRLLCRKCGSIIQSLHRHDFVRCSCGAIFVDGGAEYLRYGGESKYIEILEDEVEI